MHHKDVLCNNKKIIKKYFKNEEGWALGQRPTTSKRSNGLATDTSTQTSAGQKVVVGLGEGRAGEGGRREETGKQPSEAAMPA